MQNTEKNELFQSSHLSILLCYTIFSFILVIESLLLGWEKWVLILIVVAVTASWFLHIQNRFNDRARLWIYSILMMCTFFFYGIHETSTFDLIAVMSAVVILYTMTGIKSLITLCQATYFITLAFGVISYVIEGGEVDVLIITRTMLHVAMMVMTGMIAKNIIDKWIRVLGSSRREIEELTDATNRLNDFLANVSHEIRTPINAVIGLSGICADKPECAAIRSELLDINEAGKRVSEQISDILDFSEIDRGDLARFSEDYMLSSVLNDLVTEIRPYKRDDIELVIDIDPAIPAVMESDIGKLKKILRHLIINGLKYTREGGVYVRIASIKEDYGVNLCIEVTDTGIGMTPDEVERITERFYQANSGRSRSSSGLGLGMAIVSGFVATLGGFMKLDSRYGKGTTVRVSIPQRIIDGTSCMSVADREKLCLGAFLHFEKFPDPHVREYYNVMVRNIVKGLGVQMHRVDNEVNLKKLLDTVKLTHLFVGEEEYETDPKLMEELSARMKVIVVANASFHLPAGSRVRIMEKPFYCFPVAAVLNEGTELAEESSGEILCEGVRALVVDDEPMNLTVAKSIFGRYGMIVSTAASGQESIDMCARNSYDIVFMDHMMPGMDGVEAMKRIRADHRRSGIDMPIVALTANAVSTAREMFIREGFDGFVSKPVDLVELERVLKKVLPISKITVRKPDETTPAVPAAPTAPAAVSGDAGTAAPVAPVGTSEGEPSYEALAKYGVDIKQGLAYCMKDKEFYRSLLLQFASESGEKRAGMEKHFDGRNAKDYEILVHALKSTSKMIGCMDLSEKAKALEFAAKKDDWDYITEHHAEVFELYKRLTGGINEVLGVPDAESGNDGGDASGSASDDSEIFEFSPENGEAFEFSPNEE